MGTRTKQLIGLVVGLMLSLTPQPCPAKTVVFYPPPSTSYFVYHANVAGALADLGHQVWICVPHSFLHKKLITDPRVNVLVYGEHLGDLEAKVYREVRLVDVFFNEESEPEIVTFIRHHAVYVEFANDFLSDKTFVDKVRNLKADLFVLESIFFNINMIVLPYMLDIPYALIGTFHDIVYSRVPFSPAAPIFPGGAYSDRMSFFERTMNFLNYLIRINTNYFHDNSLVSKYAPHKPYKTILELTASAELFIAEVDHILDYPRPMLPNTKLIGGSSASPAKSLTGDIEKFVDKVKTGIVVVSFGGGVLNIPGHITSKMASAFQKLDLGVVWRANISSPVSENILISKWIPQNDLIGHNKTKLFISHCGKNGQYEALYHGVPMLCLPIFGDQFYNSKRVQVKKFGLEADMRKISAEQLADLIKEIVNNEEYSKTIKKASALYRELYKVPMKEAAYWLDHVVQYGGGYMRSPCQEMPFYQLYNFDVIGFLFAVILSSIVFLYLLIRQCYRLLKKLTSQKTKSD